jgi:DNA-binding MarR family transcriptional regulator
LDNLGKSLIDLFKQHRALLTKRLAVIDLFPGQDGLLFHLSTADGQSMSDLVEKMQIKHATLFNMVERMVKTGLLKKIKDPNDLRASNIYLTDKGRTKISELRVIWKEMESLLSGGLSAPEKKNIIEGLQKLNTNISRHL